MITAIIAPPAALAVSKPAPAAATPPRLDWLDQHIIDLVRESEPVKLWQVLNVTAAEMCPRSRAEGRKLRLILWSKLRSLVRLGLVFRVGLNSVAVSASKRAHPYGEPMQRTVRKFVFGGSVRSASFMARA